MPELRTNGSYDPYLAELFNPLGAGTPFNPTLMGGVIPGAMPTGVPSPWGFTPFNAAIGAPIPGAVAGGFSAPGQSPWSTPQAQVQQHPHLQTLQTIQICQHLAAHQIAKAIQQAQALQYLHQVVYGLIAQQNAANQPVFGQTAYGSFGAAPFAVPPQSMPSYPQSVAPFRYGLPV